MVTTGPPSALTTVVDAPAEVGGGADSEAGETGASPAVAGDSDGTDGVGGGEASAAGWDVGSASDGRACAMPGEVATPSPIHNAAASAPTRPTNLA
ncbi:hypothetical protein [Mycolicibacterium sp.]|uniref:hypothetical protein n=1 Tax=Mycolicibacterium sp. TaxID=2320850 RepID=UPI0025E257E9|nr:hypothetical protein [Mycolicibacterium sp.]